MVLKNRFLIFIFLAVAGGVASAAPPLPLPQHVTGNFYNPAQSGYGVNVEVLDEARAIVYWHVYDHAGNPMSLYMEGRIDDNRIHGSAYAPRGMRFGEFNRSSLQVPFWGELELVFQSCARATMKYSSPNGFGAGEIPLQRLGFTAQCRGGHLLPAGSLKGFIEYGFGNEAKGVVDGMVMPDASLWATVAPVRELYSYDYKIDTSTHILVAPQASGTPDRVLSFADLLPNGFLCELTPDGCGNRSPQSVALEFTPSPDGMTASLPSDGTALRVTVGTSLPSSDTLRGVFHFDPEDRVPGGFQMVMGDDGSLCVRAYGTTDCVYSGTFERVGYEPHTFELQRTSGGKPYRGVIIVDFQEIFIGPAHLRFIGTNGDTGLAINARFDFRS